MLTEASPGTWRSKPRPADYYAAKGLVEALLGSVGLDFGVEPGERPFLHPGRSATVLAGRVLSERVSRARLAGSVLVFAGIALLAA